MLTPVIRALLPPFPSLDAPTRERVERDVVEFVAAQVAGLPSYLRVPFRLALAGYDWLAVPVFGRRSASLDPERAVRYVGLWTRSPLGPMRDVVKLLRSCALLRYLDDPVVTARLERESEEEQG